MFLLYKCVIEENLVSDPKHAFSRNESPEDPFLENACFWSETKIHFIHLKSININITTKANHYSKTELFFSHGISCYWWPKHHLTVSYTIIKLYVWHLILHSLNFGNLKVTHSHELVIGAIVGKFLHIILYFRYSFI